jgi:Ras-related protein Rab-7A
VIGNKVDVEESKRMVHCSLSMPQSRILTLLQISAKRAQTFCQSKGNIPYFETSAKEAINVEQAFEGAISRTAGKAYTNVFAVIARQALAQEEVGDFNSDFPETIPIDLKGEQSGCAC